MSPHAISPAERRREGAPRLRMVVERAADIAVVRRRIRDLIGVDMSPGRRSDAMLAVTELVTNSLVHAGPGPVTLYAWLDANRLRVEVHDAGPGLPPGQGWTLPGDGMTIGGRGLALVRMVSERCGHRAAPWASVWFEMDLATGGNGRH